MPLFDSDILDSPLPRRVEKAVAFILRNTPRPLVVRGLSWLELMDEHGSGIPRMTRLFEQAGHPRPAFSIDHDCLVVELQPLETDGAERQETRDKASAPRGKNDLQPREAILEEARASGKISTKIRVQRLGISSSSAQRLFKELVAEGALTIEGSGRATHYRLT